MKKLLASSAIALVALSGVASAQSVLERVLGAINTDNTNMLPVTGTFANIAENIAVLSPTERTIYLDGSVQVSEATLQAGYDAYVSNILTTELGFITVVDPTPDPFDEVYNYDGVDYATRAEAEAAATEAAALATGSFTNWLEDESITVATIEGPDVLQNTIDGSISNTMVGITQATADVGSVIAMEEVTVDIGDLSTTVLGAVNTGDITLGVNQNVDEALAGSSSAVSATIQQLGGIANQTALVLNVASNATDVIGSVNNRFTALNGSIGNVATTVLGAVNTGTITSGINAAVTGVQAGIIGAAAN